MPVIVTAGHELRQRELLQQSRGTRIGPLQSADFAHMPGRRKPADPVARRSCLGKGTAGEDTAAAGIYFGGARAMSVEQQFAVYIVFDQANVVLVEDSYKFFALVLTHADAQRIVERCRKQAGLD